VYKAIVRYNREAIINFDGQHTIFRRPLCATDNTFQQGVDIFRQILLLLITSLR